MSRRATGTVFCATAAMLYATRYLTAAIYSSGNSGSWGNDLFDKMLGYVGNGLQTAAIIALLAGVLYLAWGEIGELRRPRA